ncbi:IS3 family transposase, partial [Pseudomonas sp. 1239]|uniref:IS3 family transposase n=1 Tax=Pseudomonas sp. 1239 TaxID=1985343 RepID=UPI00117B5611
LKRERVRRKIYTTREEARSDIFDYIEMFYNPKRRHSSAMQLSADSTLTRTPIPRTSGQ